MLLLPSFPSRGFSRRPSYTQVAPESIENRRHLAGHCDATAAMDYKFANEVTVRFAETDAQGVAHHAAYLVWFEVTRIEYLRRFRGGYAGLREEGVDALTLEAYARYSDAARFDDRLTIRARCGHVRGARFRFDYSVERDGTPVADGWTSHACVSVGDHRPTRVPPRLAEAIAEAEG
jgi:acyl-CoA thioester hydrolase